MPATLLALLCGSAQAQDGLARLVSRDALAHLTHPDAEVRGEAALVVATRPDLLQQPALLAMAKERAPAARHRAWIALGLMGSAPGVQLLGEVLDDTTTRGEDDGIVAAFGLGLVKDQQATTITTRLLSAIAQGSWKRQRSTLQALLIAMTMQADRGEAMAVRRLFDDESNRDPVVRSLMLTLLLQHDATFDRKPRQRVLARGSAEEQQALLAFFAGPGPALDATMVPAVEQLARNAADVRVRVEALAALTRSGDPEALDIALRWLRSEQPSECAQAMRTLLAIGGARRLSAFAPRLIAETDPVRKAAWLSQWLAPLGSELADHCGKLAGDPGNDWPLRTTTTLLLARGSGERATPLLRDAFRSTTETSALPALALLLRQFEPGPVPLDRLLDVPVELRAHPERWQALLRAEHPEAERQVLSGLQDKTGQPEAVLPALRTWRLTHVLCLPALHREVAPALLRGLLGG